MIQNQKWYTFNGNVYWCSSKVVCHLLWLRLKPWRKMKKRRLSSSSVVCSIWKQARIVGISFLVLWPSPTANRTRGSNTLRQRILICKYLTISGRDKHLKKVTDHNSVLTSGNLEIANRRTLGSWSCQTWFWSCIFPSFAGTGKWEGSQLPAQNQTQQRQWGWCIQLPSQPPSFSSNQMLKKTKRWKKKKALKFLNLFLG